MSSEWRLTTFAEAPFSVIDGDRGANYPKQHEFSRAGHCLFLNAGNVTQAGFVFSDCAFITEEKDSILRKGKLVRHDLVLTTRGTVGNVAYFADEVRFQHIRINSGMVILRPDQSWIEPYFLYLFLRSRNFSEQVAFLTSGSAQPQLPIRDMNRVEMLLPPLKDQRRICSTFRVIDNRITLLQETNATLEAIAQALFKSWFVDFDPVRAKAEGLEPEGMDAATAALFPDGLEESELGVVPMGWRLLPLKDAYEINPSRKLKKGEVAPYLDMASVSTQGHVVTGMVEREMGSGTKFINGDTLLARITPCLENGKSAFVDFLSVNQTGWGSTEFVVLRPRSPLPPYHGYLLARHPAFRKHAIQSMSGTSGRQRVQNDVLGQYTVAVPCDEIAEAFGDVVSGVQQKISANQEQAKTLAQLRDTLLPRLISSQLRLPEAEAQIEAVCP